MNWLESIQAAAARRIMALPHAVQARLVSKRRTVRDGYELDLQVELLLSLVRATKQPLSKDLPLPEARRNFDVQAGLLVKPPPRVARVRDEKISPRLWMRVYEPHRREGERGEPRAGLVYFHGGGFVLGGLETHDGPCRRLAAESGAVVCAVDYALAPEHAFPTAIENALQAFRHVASNAGVLGIDPARLGVGGDSAGGNLSAVVSLETRGDPVPAAAQVLIYPAVDFTLSSASIDSLATGFLLEKPTIEWFIEQYLPASVDKKHPHASPLWREDLSGAPPAVIHVAGFDPLRDEGLRYAKLLEEAGTKVTLRTFGSLFHGYLNATLLRAPDEAVGVLSDDVRAVLRGDG